MTPADRYAQLLERGRVRERSLFGPQRIPSELELQAHWYAGTFGREFRTVAGERVEIVQFGTWNREAGPDFRDAAVRLGEAEPQRGSIELDLADRSWETHGHASNPAFEDCVLHVFVERGAREFFTRTPSHRNLPQVQLTPELLKTLLPADVPLARAGRCFAPLANQPEERTRSIIEAAAQFRLRRKTARLRQMIETHGRDEALFQELAAALGYKQNKLPFTLVAQRLPLALLRANPEDAEALLFGVAGFLESPDLRVYDSATRGYVRSLWDSWWRHRDGLQRFILPGKLWKLGGARPLNHPQRRLAALAAIARAWPQLLRALADVASVQEFFEALQHSFWNLHYTLTSEAASKTMALVGETRVAEILANVLFAFWSSEGREVWASYAHLGAALTNRRVETAATRLFGDDPRRAAFLKTVAHQQGLLQIYEDFCLQDDSDCAQCPFPEQMQSWE